MISKNSFLISLRENLKRRAWVAVLFIAVYALAFPVAMTLAITPYLSMEEVTPELLNRMGNAMTQYMGFNEMQMVITVLMAVVCAVQGFSWMHQKHKVDLYLSVPVSKKKRFAVIYINSILIYAVPLFISLLLSFVVCGVNGLMTGAALGNIFSAYLWYLLLYIAVYNITLTAVMLTGHTVTSLIGAVTFLSYEAIVAWTFWEYCSYFLKTFSWNTQTENYKLFLSPLYVLYKKINEIDVAFYNKAAVPGFLEAMPGHIGGILICIVIWGAAAYLLYAGRPAEACGKAVSYPIAKPIIKVFIMVPVTLLAGLLFADNGATQIVGLALGLILSHCIIEVIYEFDIRACLHHWKSFLAAAALTIAIIVTFGFDLTGFNKRVPAMDNIESVAVWNWNIASQQYTDEEGGWMSGEEYAFKYMELTDAQPVRELSKKSGQFADDEQIINLSVKYRLRNGKSMYRDYQVGVTENREYLNSIFGSKEYKDCVFQLDNEEFLDLLDTMPAHITNGYETDGLESIDKKRFLELYQKDLEAFNFDLAWNELPKQVVKFEHYLEKDQMRSRYTQSYHVYAFPVYEKFVNTIAYLKELGVYRENYITADAIKEIHISGYLGNDTYDQRSYTGAEEIEKIVPALVPGEVVGYGDFSQKYNQAFTVEVTLKAEEGRYVDFYLRKSLMPDFLKDLEVSQ